MPSPYLVLILLLTVTVSLGTQLSLWRERSPHQQTRSGSLLETLMGDSRRLFANHFITKADIYLHSGVYPSIFDQAQSQTKSHLAAATESSVIPLEPSASPGSEHGHNDHGASRAEDPDEHDAATGFLGRPRDWIDAFGRNFFPTRHTHLEKVDQREILPWLQLAVELSPNDVQTYALGAYWLRNRMGKVKEAEEFLRAGWRANPHSFEILFELGRLREENHKDMFRARNLFEAALKEWQASQPGAKEPDEFTFMQITGHLARLEEREGHLDRAILYLEMLRKVSPSPQSIERQIGELKAKSSGAKR